MNSGPVHTPVMPNEAIEGLSLGAGSTIVDGTLGGGGHAALILEKIGPTGRLIALDRDPVAIEQGVNRFRGFPVRFAQASFSDLPEVLEQLEITSVDGILLDLGISSDQLDDPERGFSFDAPGPLDLRMDPTEGEPAWRLLERLTAEQLANIVYEFGEERYSRRVARKIVEARQSDPIRTATQLARLVRSCVPRSKGHSIDPATRTFQALRIAVNQEIEVLERGLRELPSCLRPGGRLVIISFHSLEDRPVKTAFRSDSRLLPLTKKPLTPNQAELWKNPRSRSAKMRIAERV